jgi:FMN phosphatase YigB (HAD superfamily)
VILIVDIGNVLVSVTLARRTEEIVAYQREHGLELVGYTDISNSWLTDYSAGRISTRRYLRQLSAMFHVPEGIVRRAEAACIGELNGALVNEVARISEVVSVCCLSNTQPLHWEQVASMLPPSLFLRTYLSFEMGVLKPSQAAYRKVMESTKMTGKDIAFLDDDERNLHSAQSAGWKYCFQHTSNASTLRWLRGLSL